MAQIAFEVGYESEAAFNRAFKSEYGLPPARYARTKRVSAQKRRWWRESPSETETGHDAPLASEPR